MQLILSSFFFFNDTATTEIYTLSLHDALPILVIKDYFLVCESYFDAIKAASPSQIEAIDVGRRARARDRKSTRLNSSHSSISYAVFCLKKKKKIKKHSILLAVLYLSLKFFLFC